MKGATKTKQCSKQTCIQIIVVFVLTTNTSIRNDKQVNQNTQAMLPE